MCYTFGFPLRVLLKYKVVSRDLNRMLFQVINFVKTSVIVTHFDYALFQKLVVYFVCHCYFAVPCVIPECKRDKAFIVVWLWLECSEYDANK